MRNLKLDFPIFKHKPNWVYLDTAATALKPLCLTDRLRTFYDQEYATINRAVYQEALLATSLFYETKAMIGELFHVSKDEIIFTRGTTESINLIAYSLENFFKPGDAILISEAEHHSNIVPWQLLAQRKNLKLKVFKITDKGEWDFESFSQLLTSDVKLVSVAIISNVLGTLFPVEKLIRLAKENRSLVVIDGAQAPFHIELDLKKLGCDFFACSAHKIYGPTGLGILYGKSELLEKMTPFHGGGDMIETVSFEMTTYQKPPHKFEAGTPNIADVIAFGAVLKYLNQFSIPEIKAHENTLFNHLKDGLNGIHGMQLIGTSNQKIGIQSFVIEGVHPLDLATFLDFKGIAIRTGHLCAQPLLRKFGLTHVCRISIGIYNDQSDIERLIEAIHQAKKML